MHAVSRPVATSTNVAAPSRPNPTWCRWRVTLAWLAACVVLPLGLAACGGSDSVAPTAATSVTAVIDAAGGTVTGPDGIQVIIPLGALSQATTIGIARSAVGAPSALDAYPVSGFVYELTPHDLPFNVPVTVRAPVGTTPDTQVFMASPGQPWVRTTATVTNGMAEWQRSSFSWMFTGFCNIPRSMVGDPYWCALGLSAAAIGATPASAMTQTEFPRDPANGAFGTYRVDQYADLQISELVRVPGNCSNVTVRFLHRQWADPLHPDVVAQTQTLSTQNPVMTAGPTYLTGTATITVPFSYLDSGHNQFVMAASYDCPSIIRSPNSSGGFDYSWDYRHTRHTNLWGDGIMVEGNVPTPAAFYTVGGTVSGLTGAGLVLQNNSTNFTPVATSGSFSFSNTVGASTPYNVTVNTQPAGQTCTVSNGSGTASANMSNVAVNCITTYGIGGTVGGLVGTGLVLQNNGADDKALTSNGAFAFATPIAVGGNYSVSVLTQPSASTCTVQNGTGTANATVTNVAVTCVSAGPLALVANSGSVTGVNGLSVYRVNQTTGALSLLNNVSAGNTPHAVAVTPNGLFAYVSNQMEGSVSAYGIDNATGVLTPLRGRYSNNPAGLAMDRLGRYLWVANFGYTTLSGFAIAADGTLTPVTGSPLNSTYTLPYAIVAHPVADFVYVAYQSSSLPVSVYSVDSATGALTLQQTLTNVISSATGVVIDPSGRFLYVNDVGGVCSFAIHATTGLLTAKGCIGVGGATYALAIHPTGDYIYVPTSSNEVAVYAVNLATGTLTQVGTPATVGNNPRGVTVNAAGTFLYVTNYISNDVSAFSISAGGATLTPIGAAVAAGSNPQGIAVAP